MEWIKDQLVNRDPKYVHNSNIINKLELLVNIYLIHSFQGFSCNLYWGRANYEHNCTGLCHIEIKKKKNQENYISGGEGGCPPVHIVRQYGFLKNPKFPFQTPERLTSLF